MALSALRIGIRRALISTFENKNLIKNMEGRQVSVSTYI